jgi:hypothetical protein
MTRSDVFAGFFEAVMRRCALLFPFSRFIFYKRAKKDKEATKASDMLLRMNNAA